VAPLIGLVNWLIDWLIYFLMKSEGRCHSNCEQKFGTVHTPMHPANVPEGKRFSRRRSRVCGWGECWHFHCWCEDVNYAKNRLIWLDETYASSMIRAYFFHYMLTWRYLQKRKYTTYRTAVRGGPSHGHR